MCLSKICLLWRGKFQEKWSVKKNAEEGFLQGSTHGRLLFSVYINYLSDDPVSNFQLFPDDIALFPVIIDNHLLATNVNEALDRINNTSFNADPNKQAREAIIFRKLKKSTHPPFGFSNNTVVQPAIQQHLGIFLDAKLGFQEHLKNKFHNINKAIVC